MQMYDDTHIDAAAARVSRRSIPIDAARSAILAAVAALTSKGPRHSTDGAAVVINVGACAYDVELRSWGHGGVVDMRPAGLIRLCEHHGILI